MAATTPEDAILSVNVWDIDQNEPSESYLEPDSYKMACWSHIDYQGHYVSFDLFSSVILGDSAKVQEIGHIPTPHLLPVR